MRPLKHGKSLRQENLEKKKDTHLETNKKSIHIQVHIELSVLGIIFPENIFPYLIAQDFLKHDRH